MYSASSLWLISQCTQTINSTWKCHQQLNSSYSALAPRSYLIYQRMKLQTFAAIGVVMALLIAYSEALHVSYTKAKYLHRCTHVCSDACMHVKNVRLLSDRDI